MIALIAAVDCNWAIGREGKLLFSIPEDLHRFRELTVAKTILYGRRTLSTFPAGRPLEGRTNLVLTHSPETLPEGCMQADLRNLPDELLVVGGAEVYKQMLPLCRKAWITKVEADGHGDRFLVNLDADPEWRLTACSEEKKWQDLTYTFCQYERVSE